MTAVWRRWSQRSGPERYDFWTRASLYALLAAVPVLALALARAQQHVRVPGLAVFLLLSVAQAAACVALLHASLSFYLARGSRPNRWLVAAAIALTPAGLLAGAAAFPAFTRIAAGQIPVSAWAAMLFCGALTAALTPLLSLPALVAVVLAGAAAIGAWPASTGGAGGSGPAFAAGGPTTCGPGSPATP